MSNNQEPFLLDQVYVEDGTFGHLDDGGTAISGVGTTTSEVASAAVEIDYGATESKRPKFVTIGVNVTSSDFTTGDETYKLEILYGDTASFSAATARTGGFVFVVGSGSTGGSGQFLIPSAVQGRFSRLTFVLAGTTPILVVSDARVTGKMN